MKERYFLVKNLYLGIYTKAFLCYNSGIYAQKGLFMLAQTMTDKELSEIILMPRETVRRQVELNNGAKLRYLLFKDFGKDELQKRVDDTISKHGLKLYDMKTLLEKLKKALQKDKRFEGYIFTASKEKIIAEAEDLCLKKGTEGACKGPYMDISVACKNINIYAYNPKTKHKCFFTFNQSRIIPRHLDTTHRIYKYWDIDYTPYIISFGTEKRTKYYEFEMEPILVSELLGKDADKIIIV